MRRILLALIFASATLAPAQMGTVPQQTLDCVKVLLAQERSWNAGDIDGFLTGYKDSPETIFVSRGVHKGFAELADNYRKSYPTKAAMGTLSFSDFDVKQLDENFAVVLGRFHLERKKQDGGNAEGVFSLVMEKTEGGWKIVVDHTTS